MDLPSNDKYEWLGGLYHAVQLLRPKKIVEIGSGTGTTTITMALSLLDNKIDGKINAYDMWIHGNLYGNYEETLSEIKNYDVEQFVNLEEKDFYEWLKTPEEFDFLYFDIDNNGDKLLELYEKTKHQIDKGSVIFFEGGSIERDRHGIRHEGKKMNEVKEMIGYEVVTDDIKYSSSIIYNKNLYKDLVDEIKGVI